VATGRIAADDDAGRGPVEGGCTVVNVAGGPATQRDYFEAVTGALGLEPVWEDEPAWTGRVLAERAHAWGWKPQVDLPSALDELRRGLG
jgi:nucleoside-diphosphate-sugar epimerase